MAFAYFIGLIAVLLFQAEAAAMTGASLEPQKVPRASHAKPAFMRSYGDTSPPIGFVHFCRINAAQCEARNANLHRVHLTMRRWHELTAVNDLVNTMITPASDEQLYGQTEFWTIPSTHGDCEDYVLLKRSMLMQRGWPESALLITVVKDEADEGHAVLTVRTHVGDLILDNKRDRVFTWRDTPYEFIKRQSFRNPLLWVSLNAVDQQLLSAAGAKP